MGFFNKILDKLNQIADNFDDSGMLYYIDGKLVINPTAELIILEKELEKQKQLKKENKMKKTVKIEIDINNNHCGDDCNFMWTEQGIHFGCSLFNDSLEFPETEIRVLRCQQCLEATNEL